MVVLGDHDQYPGLLPAFAQLPVHLEFGGDGGEFLAQLSQQILFGLPREFHAQEQASGAHVVELLEFHDGAFMFNQESGDRIHDPHSFGALQGQDVTDLLAHESFFSVSGRPM